MRVIERAPLGSVLGRERIFYNLEEALASWSAKATSKSHE
jgi:hypothetical protein